MLTLAFDRTKQDVADDDIPTARQPLTLAVIDDHEPAQDCARYAVALGNVHDALMQAQTELAAANAEIHSLERRLRENSVGRVAWLMAAAAGMIGFLVGVIL